MRIPDILTYTDYRLFLKEAYARIKKQQPGFSYRELAVKVGFKSAGHFTQIIKRQINLSATMVSRFVDFLGLQGKQADYFRLLVGFDQATTQAERRQYLNSLAVFSGAKAQLIDPDQYEYFDKWYHIAIRDLLSFYKFDGSDFVELSRMLRPAISAAEAKRAIELLERLGLIRRNDQGFFERSEPIVLLGDSAPGAVALYNQAIQSLDLAAKALDNFPKSERQVSGTSFSVSRKTFEQIREEARLFRLRILQLAQADPDPETVYQFNVQTFPLSRTLSRDSAV